MRPTLLEILCCVLYYGAQSGTRMLSAAFGSPHSELPFEAILYSDSRPALLYMILWCPERDSNPQARGRGFWDLRVYQFHHLGKLCYFDQLTPCTPLCCASGVWLSNTRCCSFRTAHIPIPPSGQIMLFWSTSIISVHANSMKKCIEVKARIDLLNTKVKHL